MFYIGVIFISHATIKIPHSRSRFHEGRLQREPRKKRNSLLTGSPIKLGMRRKIISNARSVHWDRLELRR
jgi:hypothetical protein